MLSTIVIPCFNSAVTLEATLAAVNGLDERDDLDVLVIDNGSTDASVAIATTFRARVLRCPARGVARARNHGLAWARTDTVLSLDADCVPRPDWAGVLLATMRAAPDDVIGIAGRTVPRPHADAWSQRADVTPHPAFDEHGAPLYAVGGNACYRLDSLLALGGFPPFGADDAALGVVARHSGMRFIWEPCAVVEHANPVGALNYIRQMAKVGRYAAQLDPDGVGGRGWYRSRLRHGVGAARRASGPQGAAVCAIASVAGAVGALRAARDPARPRLPCWSNEPADGGAPPPTASGDLVR